MCDKVNVPLQNFWMLRRHVRRDVYTVSCCGPSFCPTIGINSGQGQLQIVFVRGSLLIYLSMNKFHILCTFYV